MSEKSYSEVLIQQAREKAPAAAKQTAQQLRDILNTSSLNEQEPTVSHVEGSVAGVGGGDALNVDSGVSGNNISLRRRKKSGSNVSKKIVQTPESDTLVTDAALTGVLTPGQNPSWQEETQKIVAQAEASRQDDMPPQPPDQDIQAEENILKRNTSLRTNETPSPMKFETIPTVEDVTFKEISRDKSIYGHAQESTHERAPLQRVIDTGVSLDNVGSVEDVTLKEVAPEIGTIVDILGDDDLSKGAGRLNIAHESKIASSDEADVDKVIPAAPGSLEELEVLNAFGRGADGELLPQGESENTEKEQNPKEHLAAETRRTAEEYVRAAEKKRTLGNRLRDVLGLKGAVPDDTEREKLKAYQDAFRTEKAFEVEEIKKAHQEMVASIDTGDAEALKSAELLLQQNIADIVGSAHAEANINLYNARMTMEAEKKPGILAKIKKFGEEYNKMKLWKKVAIGASVAGLAVASGAGLLGAAGASMALGAVATRRGVAAIGSFVTFDAGLEALSQKMAKEVAENEAALYQSQEQRRSGVYDTKTEEQMRQSEAGRMVLESAPKAPESLDERLARLQTHLDAEIIGKVGDTFEARVRGLDRRRMTAMAGSAFVAFGLPNATQYFMHTEAGSAVSGAAREVAEKAVEKVEGAATVVKEVAKGAAEFVSGRVLDAHPEIGSFLASTDTVVPKGGSIWNMYEKGVVDKLGIKDSAQRLFITDRLKDIEMTKRGGDSLLKVGEIFKPHVSQSDIDTALFDAARLTPEERASILKNAGKGVREKVASMAGGLIEGKNPLISDSTRVAAAAAQVAEAQVAGDALFFRDSVADAVAQARNPLNGGVFDTSVSLVGGAPESSAGVPVEISSPPRIDEATREAALKSAALVSEVNPGPYTIDMSSPLDASASAVRVSETIATPASAVEVPASGSVEVETGGNNATLDERAKKLNQALAAALGGQEASVSGSGVTVESVESGSGLGSAALEQYLAAHPSVSEVSGEVPLVQAAPVAENTIPVPPVSERPALSEVSRETLSTEELNGGNIVPVADMTETAPSSILEEEVRQENRQINNRAMLGGAVQFTPAELPTETPVAPVENIPNTTFPSEPTPSPIPEMRSDVSAPVAQPISVAEVIPTSATPEPVLMTDSGEYVSGGGQRAEGFTRTGFVEDRAGGNRGLSGQTYEPQQRGPRINGPQVREAQMNGPRVEGPHSIYPELRGSIGGVLVENKKINLVEFRGIIQQVHGATDVRVSELAHWKPGDAPPRGLSQESAQTIKSYLAKIVNINTIATRSPFYTVGNALNEIKNGLQAPGRPVGTSI